MEILKEIKDWRSIRFFKNQKIEKEKILCILEAGRLAPSWQNLQPWHFLALENEDEKKEISKLIVTRKMTERAPLLIVILGNMEGFDMGIAKKRIKRALIIFVVYLVFSLINLTLKIDIDFISGGCAPHWDWYNLK